MLHSESFLNITASFCEMLLQSLTLTCAKQTKHTSYTPCFTQHTKHPVSSADKAANVKFAPQKGWQIFHRL